MVQLIGKGRAMHMLITGDAIDAQKAEQYGLVNEVVEQEQLLVRAKEILKKVAKKSPSAVHKVFKCITDYYCPNVNGMQREIYEFGSAFETNDFKVGTTAFLNKEKPNFRN